MKKLITLFSFLAFFSLIFIGCQSTENISGPDDLSKPGPVIFDFDDPGASTEVDLVAGQKNIVGKVAVERVDCGLKVTYTLDKATSKIYEVHVDLALDPESFSVNSQKSPVFGNFDSKTYGATITGINSNQVVVEFSCDQLKDALGTDFTEDYTGKIYIAAHSVVDYCKASAYVCPELPESVIIEKVYGSPGGLPRLEGYYLGFKFYTPVAGEYTYGAWCIDLSRANTNNFPDTEVKFFCTYNPELPTCLVTNYENLNKANWVINNKGDYTMKEIQAALWYLLDYEAFLASTKDEAGDYMELVNAADADFTPECGDYVLVIVYQDTENGPCEGINIQIAAIEVPVECECNMETAMGFNYPPSDLDSAPFNHQWFRYFAFNF